MEILSIIGGGGTLAFGIAFVTLAFLNRKDARELLAARDRIEKLDERADDAEQEVANLTARLAAAQKTIAKEQTLRRRTEIERNNAFEDGVNHVVEKLKKSNIADVAQFTATLLATPLPGWMPETIPEGRATAPGPDSLLNPFAVQPSKDP